MEKEDYSKIAKEFGEETPDKKETDEKEEKKDMKETSEKEEKKPKKEIKQKEDIPKFKIKNGVALGFQIAIGFWFITLLLLMFTAAVLILFFGFSLPVIK